MKPFTNDTHGRNHYYHAPKEHKSPKSSSDRRGTRTSVRQASKREIKQELKQGNIKMSLVKEIFTPKKHLVVNVSHDGMELLETGLEMNKTNNSLFIEIGDDVGSTTENIRTLLQEYFPNILEAAIEEECEFIQFHI